MPRPRPPEPGGAPLAPGMRGLLWVAGGLVLLAGIQLFVFSERTARFFAWTIDPPLTAAFLGASYWASVAFEWSAARARAWAGARIAVPTVFVFTTLTFVVTIVHLDRFHLGAEHEAGTRAVTWAWIAIYAIVPVLLAGLWVRQARVPGADAPRTDRLPHWLRALLAVQAAAFVGVGGVLLVAPADGAALWPWPLTPLTGRAVGAWALSLGIAAGHALWEDDVHRLRPAAHAYLVFGVLQGVALARYPDQLAWGDPEALVYLAVLGGAVVIGAATLWRAEVTRRVDPARPPAPRPTAA